MVLGPHCRNVGLRQCSMFIDFIVCQDPHSFQTVCKLSRLSGNFLDCPETFQTVWKLSRLPEIFPCCPETFQTVRKPSKLSGIFPDSSETFQTVRKLSRLSGSFPDCPKTFAIFLLDFGPNLYICAKTFRTRKNFPVGNANAPTGFF